MLLLGDMQIQYKVWLSSWDLGGAVGLKEAIGNLLASWPESSSNPLQMTCGPATFSEVVGRYPHAIAISSFHRPWGFR
jgi:hypothetical protein